MQSSLTASIAAYLVSFTLLAASPASADQCADVRMPNRVSVAGTPLVLNGMGVREATVFNVNVYVAGLYLENRSRDAHRIIDAEQKKRLVLQLVRDVSRDEMVEALTDGFRRNASDYGALRARVQRFARWMPELEEGDTLTFTYVPGQGLSVNVKGRNRGTIEGDDFARAFFAIFVGDRPPNAGLRRGLIGGGCS